MHHEGHISHAHRTERAVETMRAASQLGGVIWGAEMVVHLENELLLVHVLDG